MLNPVRNEKELLQRSQEIEGLTFLQLANKLNIVIADDPLKRKGWVGQAIEFALGCSTNNLAIPDFPELKIELKTIPINKQGKPQESTFITSIALLNIHEEIWEHSQCYHKLSKILWVPIEANPEIDFKDRRVGRAILWSPLGHDLEILKNDWQYLTNMIITGRLSEIDAQHGEYLQIRPKGASGKSLCYAFDENGQKILTLPRGFYLRALFTQKIFNKL